MPDNPHQLLSSQHLPDKAITESSDNQSVTNSESKKNAEAVLLSEFTFSQVDDDEANRMFAEYIDLSVPVAYKVKFNFTPEK